MNSGILEWRKRNDRRQARWESPNTFPLLFSLTGTDLLLLHIFKKNFTSEFAMSYIYLAIYLVSSCLWAGRGNVQDGEPFMRANPFSHGHINSPTLHTHTYSQLEKVE